MKNFYKIFIALVLFGVSIGANAQILNIGNADAGRLQKEQSLNIDKGTASINESATQQSLNIKGTASINESSTQQSLIINKGAVKQSLNFNKGAIQQPLRKQLQRSARAPHGENATNNYKGYLIYPDDFYEGVISGCSVTKQEKSKEVCFTATAAGNYVFGYFGVVEYPSLNRIYDSFDNPFCLPLESDKDIAVVATFVPKTINITVDINPVNSGTVTGTGTYTQGTSRILTATPKSGYKLNN